MSNDECRMNDECQMTTAQCPMTNEEQVNPLPLGEGRVRVSRAAGVLRMKRIAILLMLMPLLWPARSARAQTIVLLPEATVDYANVTLGQIARLRDDAG